MRKTSVISSEEVFFHFASLKLWIVKNAKPGSFNVILQHEGGNESTGFITF